VLIDRADQDEDCPSLSDLQKQAINFLDEVCERSEIQLKFTMKRGEILLLNNWTTLHRRTAFEDFSDQEHKRHLLRIWLSVPNSRPLDTSFTENFGSTEAGAVRGGMKPIS
jgi:alpha-ketoglutarate-dependent taurine dioxygenase